MKKIIIVLLCVLIILISVFYINYINYNSKQNELKKDNLEYEKYSGRQVDGRELTTIINKAVDNNEKNSVSKDENGFYIKDDTNSINIDIKIIDNDITYKMETIYNGGMEAFVQYYNSIFFECQKIEYNSLGKINYMLFEQKTT